MVLNARRELLGSPIFSYSNTGTLASNAITIFDFSINATEQQKYAPFNFLVITNNSDYAIQVQLNQDSDRTILVPSGVIREIDKKTAPALNSILVKNIGSGTIAASELTFEVQKEVIDGETIIQRAARSLFGGASHGL